MSFALPGAVSAKLADTARRVLAAVGDGAFLINSQEFETAARERIPLAVLSWQDDAYGLIKWKMDLELGHDVATGFTNPDFAAYAGSFGALITCPVDYSENLQLTDTLGELTGHL